MSHPTPTPASHPDHPFDQALLRFAGRIVPLAERPDWQRSWQAELWHKRNSPPRQEAFRMQARTNETRRSPARMEADLHTPDPSRLRPLGLFDLSFGRPWPTADLAPGLLRDAVWLRAEAAKRGLRGTALLCLASLLALLLLASSISLALYGGPHTLALRLADLLPRITLAAALVILVTFSVAPRRPAHQTFTRNTPIWLKRQLFFAAKLVLLLVLTFFLSTDLTANLTPAHPLAADFLQILSFVLFAVIALRWAVADQEGRCKVCLRRLSAPARVGRPSRNLLEWNGTQLTCNRGHGLLTIPELETSWCQSSQWISNRNTIATT